MEEKTGTRLGGFGESTAAANTSRTVSSDGWTASCCGHSLSCLHRWTWWLCDRTYLLCHAYKMQQWRLWVNAGCVGGQCWSQTRMSTLVLFRPKMIISSLIDEPIGLLVGPPSSCHFREGCPAPPLLRAATPANGFASQATRCRLNAQRRHISQPSPAQVARLSHVLHRTTPRTHPPFCRALSVGAYKRA